MPALLLLLLACKHPSTRAPEIAAQPGVAAATDERLANPAPSGSVKRAEPVATADLGDPGQQFLVHTESREVVLRALNSDAKRVVLKRADAALFQPELELLWFRDGSRFGVVDLRKADAPEVSIAEGMPDEDRWFITRGRVLIAPEDGCDLPYISFQWSATPELKPVLTEAPDLRISNQAWLSAELARPTRPVGRRQLFTGKRLSLAKKLLACEDPSECGKTASFSTDKELVLVRDQTGGDCVERACLLHDPATNQFATPPKAEKWGPAKTTAPGPCGIYEFEQTKSSFLLDHRLCNLDRGCTDLGGEALGWLVAGERVGASGTGDFPE
jgi:hypothetical protein